MAGGCAVFRQGAKAGGQLAEGVSAICRGKLNASVSLLPGISYYSGGSVDAEARNRMQSPTTVLIVDDHAIVRQGLRMMLESQPQVEVVGEAPDVEIAVTLARKHTPDLILMDLLMPGLSAVDGIQQIRRISVNSRILVLSSSTEDHLIKGALEAGAHGYILKASRPAALLEAIEKVMSGVYALDPIASQVLVRGVQQNDPISTLTSRERDVFDLMALGRSNTEIAQTLVVSEGTIRTHIANLLDKLQLRDRTQVTIYALKRGLIRVEDLP